MSDRIREIEVLLDDHLASFSADGITGSCLCGWECRALDAEGNDALNQHRHHLAWHIDRLVGVSGDATR